MDRFFYYLLGALVALLLALGAISFLRDHDVPEAESTPAGSASPSPTFTPEASPGFGGTADVPQAVGMATPSVPATPTPVPWSAPNYGEIKNLTYPGYTVVYSLTLSNPLAVQYAMVGGAKPKRWPAPPKIKTPNPELILQAGYGRGPMALSESITLYFGKEAGRNTKLMTNICAFQPPCLSGPWAAFGELESKWAGSAGWIEVVAGPIFGNPAMQTPNGVVVPAAFYRAYRRSYGDTQAFIIPQTATSSDLSQYLTSVSAIEAAAGVSIFPNTLLLDERNKVADSVW